MKRNEDRAEHWENKMIDGYCFKCEDEPDSSKPADQRDSFEDYSNSTIEDYGL